MLTAGEQSGRSCPTAGPSRVPHRSPTRSGAGRIAAIPGGGEVGWFPTAALVVVAVALVSRWSPVAWSRVAGSTPSVAPRRPPSATGSPSGRADLGLRPLRLMAGVAALLTMGKADAGLPGPAPRRAQRDRGRGIGGASFLGGRGWVLNALTGALVIAVLRNGLNLLGIDPNWQYMATGVVIVVAVELDVLRGHLERRFRSSRRWRPERPRRAAGARGARGGQAVRGRGRAGRRGSPSSPGRCSRSWATTARASRPSSRR